MGTIVDIQVDGEKETEGSDFGKAGVEFSKGTAVDGEKDTEESDFQKSEFRKIVASDPVVYQLVRVFVCIACLLSFEYNLLRLCVDVVHL